MGGSGACSPGKFEIYVLENAISSVLRDNGGRFDALKNRLLLKLFH